MYRNEYPRPQFARNQWGNLNGVWQYTFDDENKGFQEKWYKNKENFNDTINVPFVYQSQLSGVEDKSVHEIIWYYRQFEYNKQEDTLCMLHFGAVDYHTTVYVNGELVGEHEGGHTSFSFDITHYVNEGENSLAIRVYDPIEDELIPRGKQFWESESRGIWYTNSLGIWQTVWLENVPKKNLSKVSFTPNVDKGTITMDFKVSEATIEATLNYKIYLEGKLLINDRVEIYDTSFSREVDLLNNKIFRSNFHEAGWLWTPENPVLFDVEFVLEDKNIVLDEVSSYFGMRKIHTEKGMTFLNNRPYYQKLILDQGYWPEGLLTAPTDDDYVKDIELSKQMGFNGCRKHQKVEDPRFLYWADKLGYLVWGECASAPSYSNEAVNRLTCEWMEIIERDYNHPSIVTWVPLNESWGVPNIHGDKQQQSFSKSMYYFLHSIDTTRLVISNDGWEMTETDICAIHNYAHGQKNEIKKYHHFKETLRTVENLINIPPVKWDIFASGSDYKGQPILLTEFGGIGYKIGEQSGWGYTSVENEEQFIEDYSRIMDAIYSSTALWGYCYTQLTDVEQEINGLLTYDRKPKVSLEKIKEINDQYYPERIYIKL
ncbi:glycoside hydrolase family 2 protein [Vagococcus zengguangii]|uniref:Glycoside hydrolase family 2 n=1 Tax=Vagococcus zengguangii TaxID=2571750 RepID=A0A4D7CSE3_9ENTE|nr:sugar-binding domain-containing protein [Vagococcus zengguangii]QCI86998.1 glycoside hydrolase family 2 [Vagococcus zengguangii]TLG80960.1 glycoside hydrolase family 2 [Vagococcus zengguangii]